MKKDRNSFFSQAQMSSASFMPQQMPPMPAQQMPSPAPYQAAQASQSFYAGPSYMPMQSQNVQPMMPVGNEQTSDIESRIHKMERQIRRLETRINKLESAYSITGEEADVSITNSMYMI